MTSPLDNGNRWPVLGVALFILGCIALVAEETPALALVNESPSLPRGLYVRQPGAAVDRGAVVAIAQPPAARAYLGGLGMPAEVLLIKRVAAVGGERVCRQGGALETPERWSQILERDRRGQPLPAWSGCRTLGPDEVFLLGDTPSSFDSRYFGPVPVSAITGVYGEAMTW